MTLLVEQTWLRARESVRLLTVVAVIMLAASRVLAVWAHLVYSCHVGLIGPLNKGRAIR